MFIAIELRFVVWAAAAAVFCVFCRVCEAQYAARALNVHVNIALVGVF